MIPSFTDAVEIDLAPSFNVYAGVEYKSIGNTPRVTRDGVGESKLNLNSSDALIGTRFQPVFQMLLWKLEKPGVWTGPAPVEPEPPRPRPRAASPAGATEASPA